MATIRVKRSTGSTAPSVGGITFGEPAFVDGLNSVYVAKNNGTIVRVGAEVDTSTALGTSDNKLPTQLAVKTYVDNNVAGGAVSSLNGLTGGVFIGAGTAISLAAAAKGITVTNTGVQSLTVTSGSGIQAVSGGTTGAVSVTISNTGVTGLAAGTGISVSSATGNITVTNTGVTSLIAGNQATVSGSTGAVTIGVTSNPSFTTLTTTGNSTVGGNLTVTGNLTINGTTTTVNADAMTIDDPIITLGLSGGLPLTVSDGGKDRGIAFTYYTGAAGATGFFGWDASATRYIFTSSASVNNEVVTGTPTYAGVQASSFYAIDALTQNAVQIAPTSNASNAPTYTLPDYASGTFLIPANEGTSNFIIKSNGSASQPTWINPNLSGFTAFTSTNNAMLSDTSDTNAFLVFVNTATDTNQALKYNSGLTYNAVTNSLTATTFVGALSGNATTATTASTATNATNVAMLSDTSDTNAFISFVNTATDTNQALKYNSGLTYNAVSNSLTATTFVGALSGNATTATTATNATNVATTVDNSDTLAYITFVNLASDTNQGVRYNSGLTYNAATNALAATTIIGSHIGNSSTATALQTARTIGITGDVWGSASFDGTANINISATIQPDSVVLGTDTTGNYLATLSTTAGAGLSISGSGSENAAVTINLSKITTGIDFGNFAFTTGEFTNSAGTVAIGTVDGGSF